MAYALVLITARVGFESQGDYCEKNNKRLPILIENAIVSFVVSLYPNHRIYSVGGAAWANCVKSLPHYISMTGIVVHGKCTSHSYVSADTTQPVSQGSSCHELSSDPLTSGPDS